MEVANERARRRARAARRSPTIAETALWKLLRDRGLGLKFRRQAPIGRFVVDFACYEARLVVEVDGGVHRLREHEDAERDAWLSGQGFTVIRFSNQTVISEPHRVLQAVRAACNSPSPLAGEGGARSASDEG